MVIGRSPTNHQASRTGAPYFRSSRLRRRLIQVHYRDGHVDAIISTLSVPHPHLHRVLALGLVVQQQSRSELSRMTVQVEGRPVRSPQPVLQSVTIPVNGLNRFSHFRAHRRILQNSTRSGVALTECRRVILRGTSGASSNDVDDGCSDRRWDAQGGRWTASAIHVREFEGEGLFALCYGIHGGLHRDDLGRGVGRRERQRPRLPFVVPTNSRDGIVVDGEVIRRCDPSREQADGVAGQPTLVHAAVPREGHGDRVAL